MEIKLFAVANKIREKFCGNKIETCTITNAKSGKCSEDCKFCAQSEKYNTHIHTYPLKDIKVLEDECKTAIEHKSDRFAIVTSGNCKFCAQSEKYNTHIHTYPLKDIKVLEDECKTAIEHKSDRFAIVTSGKEIKKGTQDYEVIKKFAENMSKDIEVCCSIGLLDEDELQTLKDAGVSRYKKRYSRL